MSKTQNERLLVYLQAGNVIDPLQSWQNLGIYRLAARIHDLKSAGAKINKAWVTVFNRFGEKIKVRAYWIQKEDGELK